MVVTPLQRAIRCAKSDVNKYHQALSASAAAALGAPFQIRPVGFNGDWRKVGRGKKIPSRIGFSLVSGVVTSAAHRSQPDYVLKIPTLPSGETTLGWWLSWFEEWETVTGASSEVTLRSASFGFFCGNRYAAEPEELVFRAEWGPFNLGIIQNGNAAHPHWHAHHEVICENAQGGGQSVVKLHGFHLPMGGWTHSAIEPAACWQFAPPKPDDPSILREWAVRTMGYFKTQMVEEEIERASGS
jgi:hypothetical protein